jgi:hypothetical protein
MLTETRLRVPFSVIGRRYQVPASLWLQGKCARIYLSQAASGMILQNYIHRRLPASIFSDKIGALGSLLERFSKLTVIGRIFKINRGIFWIFYIFIQNCFICRPSDSTVSEDAGIEQRTVATSALAVRRSNHSTRSHPQLG